MRLVRVSIWLRGLPTTEGEKTLIYLTVPPLFTTLDTLMSFLDGSSKEGKPYITRKMIKDSHLSKGTSDVKQKCLNLQYHYGAQFFMLFHMV